MRYILTLFLTLFLTNCVAGMKPEDFKDQKPRLIIEEFLNGNVKAYGVLQNRGGKVTLHNPGQKIIYLVVDLKRRKKKE